MSTEKQSPLAGAHRPMTILVPLDGSRMAESVLGMSELLASRCQATVMLLHVIEKKGAPQVHGDRHLTEAAEAEDYLRAIRQRLEAAGIAVLTHVHPNKVGDVAESIVEHADEVDADLVALCTHGGGGVRDLLYGSIAQQTLKRGRRPILLVPPTRPGAANTFQMRTILLPYERRHEHALALQRGGELATLFSAELHIALVVPTADRLTGAHSLGRRFLPTTTKAVLEAESRESEAELNQIAARCPAGTRIHTAVLRGDPVEEVLRYAARVNADLIIMASHGQAGLPALFSASVAPRIAGASLRPVLLLRKP